MLVEAVAECSRWGQANASAGAADVARASASTFSLTWRAGVQTRLISHVHTRMTRARVPPLPAADMSVSDSHHCLQRQNGDQRVPA